MDENPIFRHSDGVLSCCLFLLYTSVLLLTIVGCLAPGDGASETVQPDVGATQQTPLPEHNLLGSLCAKQPTHAYSTDEVGLYINIVLIMSRSDCPTGIDLTNNILTGSFLVEREIMYQDNVTC